MLDNNALHVTQELLHNEDFFMQSHRKIYQVMEQLSEKSMAIDLLTVKDALEVSGELEKIGGAVYISSLVDGLPKSANVEYYAKIVKEKAILRELIHSSQNIISNCLDSDTPSEEILDIAEASIFKIAGERLRTQFLSIKDVAKESLDLLEQITDHKGAVQGVPTGYETLDKLTMGFQAADLIIVAARPSMGKTAFCLNVARNVAMNSTNKVGIFSLEMSKEQLFLRMLCSEARIDSHRLRQGKLSKDEVQKIKMAFHTLSESNIFIDDTPGIGIIEMRAKARRLKANQGLDILFVDYMQLMHGRARYENRNQEITDISRSLKELAKELKIPVIVVSQLSRAPEKRGGNYKPQLSDLRESGAIEQDADVVIFIYREELYKEGDNKGVAEMIIAKQRNGPTDSFPMTFIREYTKFENPELIHTEIER
jgi:replicative DNA helicase